MQSLEGAVITSYELASTFARTLLSCHWMTFVRAQGPGFPRAIGPETCALAVQRRILVHAVVNIFEVYSLHDVPCFQ